MRKSLASAAVCSLVVVSAAVGAATVPVAVAATGDPGKCSIEYNADQVPALAAGVLGDDLIFFNGSRTDALALWEKKQSELRAGIGENGWGTLTQIDDAKLWEPGVTHTSSALVLDDLKHSSKGLTVTADSPFSHSEAAYLANAASYTAQRYADCGKDVNRVVPVAPSSISLGLAPNHIALIVVALLGVLGAVGAGAAGMIPGVTLPALPF
ncbi:hypothetical protein HMPREF3171_09040 [Corynebacterium sp. HMSC08F01]|uniref:hypothetical protein n=1 Tax=Corynebacterium sp. HMSC08F01 TaxID=1581139 RepID=UPI0008A53BB2|nr:hypothetical protein [Corynebacterium sp. HMSC08F01]OFT28391.1 hypothetical protein HMPREF3171_09040 [Corynebacterium sp. HMSC08F01]